MHRCTFINVAREDESCCLGSEDDVGSLMEELR